VTKPEIKTLRVWDFCDVIQFIAEKYKVSAHEGVPDPRNVKGRVLYADLHQSVWHWLTDRSGCGVDKVFYLPVGYWGPSDKGTQEALAPEGLKHVGRFLDLIRKEFADEMGDVIVHYTK
jgi:hypothetical protein